jgi:hypothetical protein
LTQELVMMAEKFKPDSRGTSPGMTEKKHVMAALVAAACLREAGASLRRR